MANYTKKVNDGKNFSIYLDRPHLEHVKRMAREMSRIEDRDISAAEAIRMALEKVYPMHKQMDMFETKKARLKREYQENNQLSFLDAK